MRVVDTGTAGRAATRTNEDTVNKGLQPLAEFEDGPFVEAALEPRQKTGKEN